MCYVRTRGPLAGVTVLEVGVFMASPYATMQLADLGARVLKVETRRHRTRSGRPDRSWRGTSSSFARLNRNKESVALDLKAPAGRAAFLRLAAAADAVVETFGRARCAASALDYPAVRSQPGIVYASGSGWGQDGPLAALPGLDIMAEARGGLMSIIGLPTANWSRSACPCATWSAASTSPSAWWRVARARPYGRGQYLDVSLYESVVSLSVWEAGGTSPPARSGAPSARRTRTRRPTRPYAARTAG